MYQHWNNNYDKLLGQLLFEFQILQGCYFVSFLV